MKSSVFYLLVALVTASCSISSPSRDAIKDAISAVKQVTLPHVVAQADSLKVVGHDDFPKDLTTQIHLGVQAFPYFDTSGNNGQLDSATINITPATSVTLLRSDGKSHTFILYFFNDQDSFFDLNMDGQWDIKKTISSPHQNFIWLNGNWTRVDKITGIPSTTPTATAGSDKYEFQHEWKMSQTNEDR